MVGWSIIYQQVLRDRTRGNGSKSHQGRFRLDTWKHFFARGRSNPGTSWLERWMMPQACQCLKGVWTIPLLLRFSFWSLLESSSRWARWSQWTISFSSITDIFPSVSTATRLILLTNDCQTWPGAFALFRCWKDLVFWEERCVGIYWSESFQRVCYKGLQGWK